jgi:hypothetical protein
MSIRRIWNNNREGKPELLGKALFLVLLFHYSSHVDTLCLTLAVILAHLTVLALVLRPLLHTHLPYREDCDSLQDY